jgi:hypothetical protein
MPLEWDVSWIKHTFIFTQNKHLLEVELMGCLFLECPHYVDVEIKHQN